MWLLSFGVTAGVVLCGRLDWLSALAGGVGAFLLFNIVRGRPGQLPPALVRMVQVLWITAILAVAAKGAAALFPDAGNPVYVPAVVLALSWLLARYARDGVLACCVIVGFFVLSAVAVVAIFAFGDFRWPTPEFRWQEAGIALAVGCGGMLLRSSCPEAKPGLLWSGIGFLAPAILSLLVDGCLSPLLAAQQESAFYTLSRSISLFGVMERFEALVAACLTLGLCSACALALHGTRQLLPPKACDGVTAFLVLGAMALSWLKLPALWLAGGTAILWILLPLIFSFKRAKKTVDNTGIS